MRKIGFILVMFLLGSTFVFGSNDDVLAKTKVLIEQKKYNEAIDLLNSVVNEVKKEQKKEVTIDLAFCYFNNNQKKQAGKLIINAVKLGLIKEQDFIYNDYLNSDLGEYVLKDVYNSF